MLPRYNMLLPSEGLSGKPPQKRTAARDTQQPSKPAVAIPFPAPW